MTAQIGDIYKYEGKQYSIVAMSAPIGFKPQDYGLNPQSCCTACWDGYWCEYQIENRSLLLKNFYMFNSEGNYPPFNGVNVSEQTYHEGRCVGSGKKKAEKIMLEDNMGHRVYKNVNLPIPYTGHVLVGDGFIPGYYIHMGYQNAWAYETLLEFIFENGKLVKTEQHSEMAKKLRAEIAEGVKDARDIESSIESFVAKSFSLDMKDKAWWITT